MNNYDIGIRRFIRDGWGAVKAGYRPGYLDCVAFAAGNTGNILKSPFKALKEFENPLSMTIGEILFVSSRVVLLLIIAATYPIGLWFWAWVMSKNIDHWVKQQDSTES